jgi:hypothetical protein
MLPGLRRPQTMPIRRSSRGTGLLPAWVPAGLTGQIADRCCAAHIAVIPPSSLGQSQFCVRQQSLGEPVMVGVGDGLGAVADACFGEEMVDVAFYRGLADHEPVGDLVVR